MDDATITSLFLPPYQAAVKNGARIVMTTFSSTHDGGKVTGDKHWITDVLKTQLGFTGFVVSDWGAIDQIAPGDYAASVKAAINAGEDMVMVPDDYRKFQSTLKGLVASGDVPQSRIDDAVTRILRVKFEMGLFENPMPPAGKWGRRRVRRQSRNRAARPSANRPSCSRPARMCCPSRAAARCCWPASAPTTSASHRRLDAQLARSDGQRDHRHDAQGRPRGEARQPAQLQRRRRLQRWNPRRRRHRRGRGAAIRRGRRRLGHAAARRPTTSRSSTRSSPWSTS